MSETEEALLRQPETADASLLSDGMSEHSQLKSSLEKRDGQDHFDPQGDRKMERNGGVESEYDEQGDQQDEAEEEQDDHEEEADDEDNSALKKAARAGIRLLEENAQLAEEVRQLQLQVTHGNDQNQELQRMLEDKDAQMQQLTQHLRESICENQSVLSELNQAKEQVAGYKDLLTQQQQQQQRSPRKRNPRSASPKRVTQQQQEQHLSTLVFDGIALTSSPDFGNNQIQKISAAEASVAEGNEHASSFRGDGSSSSSSSPVGPISPKRRQAAKLEEVEAKFEEAHRRNSILKMELTSAQKQVNKLKPLNAQLHEAKQEIQVLRVQIEQLEKQLNLALEERTEENELIQSLRTTLEIYQNLDDPNRSAKLNVEKGYRSSQLFGELDDDDRARRISKMRRRKSDGCVIPFTAVKAPICWTSPIDDCFHTHDDSEAILESLDNLAEQLLSLKQQQDSLFQSCKPLAKAKDDTNITTTDVWPRTKFLEQQVSALQDLLKRYRAQWRLSTEKRTSMEIENGNLLSRVEALNLLAQRQCEMCMRANEDMTQENEAWKGVACAYKTLLRQAADAQSQEDEAELEHMCFSILRRLVDSWTADKSKRMKLHDWLTNAIRSTGKRKPLYLPDLSDEIASGFQMLLVPIFRQKFGVEVQIEKRLRNVVVTDLKLHITDTDSKKAKACLQRISRSLMWLVDVESAQLEEREWLGEFARKKSARMCMR